MHFPLGAVPWPELEKARAWLAERRSGEPVMSAHMDGVVTMVQEGRFQLTDEPACRTCSS